MKITEIIPSEYSDYYSNYLSLVPKDVTLMNDFNEGFKYVVTFFESLPENKLNYAYANGKWTVKEVFQHLIDTERVFQYRCFCIARQDQTPFPGFEQNDYIEPSNAKDKSLEALIVEFKSVRYSFITLLGSFKKEDLLCVGNVNSHAMSARAAAFIVLGHYNWHIKIIKERYL